MVFIIVIFSAIIIGLLIYKAHQNTKRVVINRVTVPGHRTTGEDASLKILHLSDLHLERISLSPTRLYEMLKDEPIDLIALTGDFMDKKRSLPKLVPYMKVFNRLNPELGTYAVFGNHDYVLDEQSFLKLKQTLEQHGCKTMRNEHDRIIFQGELINVIGIDDYCTERSCIEKAYRNVEKGYNLVLTHDPNLVLEMRNDSFDYLLSGHFHGGQICWPKPYHMRKTMGKLVHMDILKGLHYADGKPYYINEGLSQSGVNMRIGSRPEITIHELSLNVEDASQEVVV